MTASSSGLGGKVVSREKVDADLLLGRFQKWANVLARKKMKMQSYCDGEPYFNFGGVCVSVSQWLENFVCEVKEEK